MIKYRSSIFAAVLAAMVSPVGASAADAKDEASFTIYIRGIKAGILAFSAVEKAGNYAASGKMESSGLIGALVKVRYDAKVRGRVSGMKYTPSRYEEKADTGKRSSESYMEYKNGVPQVKKYLPPRAPRPQDIDPATQAGTVDPMTTIYAALRDVTREEACKLNVTLFDGRRRSRVTLANPTNSGDTIQCKGEYRRLEGFSEKEMAEKQRFAFKMTYAPNGNGKYHVTKVAMDTLYGSASMNRR